MYANGNKGHYPHQLSTVPENWDNWPIGNFAGPVSADGQNYTGAGPVLAYNQGYAKDPRVFYCPTVDKAGDQSFFSYAIQAPNWTTNGSSTNGSVGYITNNWYNVYTGYVIWANLGQPGPLPQNTPPWIGQVFADANFNTAYAWGATSPGTTLIASDMVGISDDVGNMQGLGPGVFVGGWTIKTSHTDNHQHSIFDQWKGLHGTHVPIQGYGGNYLYNDGHVDWKRMDQVQIRYQLKYTGNYWTYLAYP
jgi:prepilin-type processing-associated H-X9-DG protein